MIELYVLLSIPFGWMLISRLQRNMVFFTTVSNYFAYKAIISVLIGWAVTPFYLIYFLFRIFGRKRKSPHANQ